MPSCFLSAKVELYNSCISLSNSLQLLRNQKKYSFTLTTLFLKFYISAQSRKHLWTVISGKAYFYLLQEKNEWHLQFLSEQFSNMCTLWRESNLNWKDWHRKTVIWLTVTAIFSPERGGGGKFSLCNSMGHDFYGYSHPKSTLSQWIPGKLAHWGRRKYEVSVAWNQPSSSASCIQQSRITLKGVAIQPNINPLRVVCAKDIGIEGLNSVVHKPNPGQFWKTFKGIWRDKSYWNVVQFQDFQSVQPLPHLWTNVPDGVGFQVKKPQIIQTLPHFTIDTLDAIVTKINGSQICSFPHVLLQLWSFVVL